MTGPRHSAMRNALSILAVFLSLQALYAQDPGFFLDNWEEKTVVFPAYDSIQKNINTPTVRVQVDRDSLLGKIPTYIYGHNAISWDNGLPQNTTAMTDLRNLRPRVLRWPAGSGSNAYFWNLKLGERPPDIPANLQIITGMTVNNWELSLDQYYALREEVDAQGIITVNYSYARYGLSKDPVAQAAHLAADWVRYDNGRTRFWDIGNENFGSWEKGFEIDTSLNQDGQPFRINGQLYGQHCRVFMDSMRAAAAEVGNDIKIGVVAYDAESSWTPNEANWNEEMMPEVGPLADYLIVHSYYTNYEEDSPVSTILNSALTVPERIMHDVRSDMTEAGQEMIPVDLDEWNIFAVGSMQQVSYINGMHAALVLGQYALKGYGMAARWDLVNGWAGGNDHGLFSSGGEPGVDPYNPRPAFFYMYYWQNTMGDRMIRSEVDGSGSVTAYASSFSSGDCGLVLINRGNSPETVEVDFENFIPGDRFYYYTLTGGSDNGDFSRKVYINGAGTSEEGGGPDNYASIKAKASGTKGGIRIPLPARGTVYLMVEEVPLRPSLAVISDPGRLTLVPTLPIDPGSSSEGFTVVSNWEDTLTIDSIGMTDAGDTLNIFVNEEIGPLDIITLSYSGDSIFTVKGKQMQVFENFQVFNLLPGSPPLVTEAFTDEDGRTIKLTFSKEMEAGETVPGDFAIADLSDGATSLTPDSLELEPSGLILKVLLEEPLYAEYKLVVSYGGNTLHASNGGILAPFDSLAVTNLSPGQPPVVNAARLISNGLCVEVTFSKDMGKAAGLEEEFRVTVDGEDRALSGVTVNGNTMILSLEETAYYYQEVFLGYSGYSATSTDRGMLQPFTDFMVENPLDTPVIFPIPGMLDAEQYMNASGLQLMDCTDEGGGKNLTGLTRGDYSEYMIQVVSSGPYKGFVRTAAIVGIGQLEIRTPDASVKDHPVIEIPSTGNMQAWTSVPVQLTLEEGLQRLVLYVKVAGFNLNWLSLEPDTSTALHEEHTGRFRLYPNPASGSVVLESGGDPVNSVRITDLGGRLVFSVRPEHPAGRLTLNLPLPGGMYLMYVGTDTGVHAVPLVVN